MRICDILGLYLAPNMILILVILWSIFPYLEVGRMLLAVRKCPRNICKNTSLMNGKMKQSDIFNDLAFSLSLIFIIFEFKFFIPTGSK